MFHCTVIHVYKFSSRLTLVGIQEFCLFLYVPFKSPLSHHTSDALTWYIYMYLQCINQLLNFLSRFGQYFGSWFDVTMFESNSLLSHKVNALNYQSNTSNLPGKLFFNQTKATLSQDLNQLKTQMFQMQFIYLFESLLIFPAPGPVWCGYQCTHKTENMHVDGYSCWTTSSQITLGSSWKGMILQLLDYK